MIKEEELAAKFKETDAIIHGHFVLAGGDHSDIYLEKRKATADTELVSRICLEFAMVAEDKDIDVVVGPASGAISLAHETAKWLTFLYSLRGKKVLALYADKKKVGNEEDFEFKGLFGQMVKGKKVLVVEDILTSGQSVKKVVKLIEAWEGIVVSVCAIWNRKKVTAATIGTPELFAIIDKPLSSWPADKCDLCKKEQPVYTLVGHGKEFLQQKGLERLKQSYR